MAKQTHTPKALHNVDVDLVALAADLNFVAADVTNKEQVVHTGKEVILAWNTDGAIAYTVTITSVEDPLGRLEHMGPYTIAAGKVARFGPFHASGWKQTDGNLYFEANNAAVKFAVMKIA